LSTGEQTGAAAVTAATDAGWE